MKSYNYNCINTSIFTAYIIILYIIIIIFIAHTFSMHVGLYKSYKHHTRFTFRNINLEPMCIIRRCGFQNGGLKSNRYDSP